jgi:hypothetical protein
MNKSRLPTIALLFVWVLIITMLMLFAGKSCCGLAATVMNI